MCMHEVRVHCYQLRKCIQWNPSKTDTIGTNDCVRYSKGVLSSGLVVDHAPPIIAANYDKARLWTTKKTVLMRVLLTESF